MPLAAEKIAAYQRKLNLTNAECARRAGMTRHRWAEYLEGRRRNPTLDTLEKIAGALETTIDSIVANRVANETFRRPRASRSRTQRHRLSISPHR